MPHTTIRSTLAVSTILIPLVIVAAFLAAAPAAAHQAAIVPCNAPSLISAIASAVTAGGTQSITLSAGCTYTLTTVNNGSGVDTNGLPVITNTVNLTIHGNGATIVRAPGAPRFRFFQVLGPTTLTLNHLTLAGGFAPDGVLASSGRGGNGGAISVDFATLNVTNSTLRDNHAGNGGSCCSGNTDGLGGVGGAIFNAGGGSVYVTNSTISGNSAGDAGSAGGGIGGYGAGIYNSGGFVILTNSTISGNRAGNGTFGGGFGGGLASVAGTIQFLNSTLSANATGNSTGIPGFGGAIMVDSGTISLTNSTVASNSVGTGGSTGGIALLNTSPALLKNVLLAFNAGGNCGGFSNLVAGSTNNMSNTNCGPFFTQQTAAQINLGQLQNNGGTTLTMGLLSASAAIDAADSASCPATDQRGRRRPFGAACDIGALETPVGLMYLPLLRR